MAPARRAVVGIVDRNLVHDPCNTAKQRVSSVLRLSCNTTQPTPLLTTPRTRAGGDGLDFELETSEPAAQTALDIALGRGHGAFATALRAAIAAAASSGTSGGGDGGGGEASSSAAGSAAVPPSASLAALSGGSAAMKTPVDAAGKLCSICYCDDHDAGSKGVGCDEDHFICEECFVGYVTSESDTVSPGTLSWLPSKS